MVKPINVLLVEDSEDDAELTRLELEQAGYQLNWRRVDTEQDFLDALTGQRWDAIISDYQMPEFNGLRAFQLFRQSGIDAPFIFVSGELGEERAVEAMRSGARDYIMKGNLARLGVAMTRELQEAENRRRQAAAEEAVQREQRCMAMAMEATGAGVVEFSLPLRADTYIAGRWKDILGVASAEMPAHDRLRAWFADRIHEDDRQRAEGDMEAFFTGRSERLNTELRVRHASGAWVEVMCLARAIERAKDGRALRVVAAMLDLTERRKLESQLRHSQKLEAVGSLAGGIAHDFNNILTVILGYTDLLMSRGPEFKPPQPQYVEQIHRAANRAADLTRKLLAFSRKQIIAPRIIDLNIVVDDMSAMIKRLIGEDINFVISPARSRWKVSADPGQVEQVIMNLVVNARDAMPDGGRLMIETADITLDEEYCREHADVQPGPCVMLAVSDTGTGMDAATVTRIFEPFFTTKERGKGTGLGLATVYGIVKQNRAHIAVYTEPGKGTVFKIYWPRATGENVDEAATPARTGLPVGHERILFVEDDEQVRAFGAGVLTSLGYVVTQAVDGVDALARARAAEFDVVITDVIMPRMGGRELVERLRSDHPGLRVVYASGYTANAIVHQGVLEAGLDFVAKPYSPQELATKVRHALDRRE